MKYSICFFIAILIVGCTTKQDLKNVNKISEKLIVFEAKELIHSENRITLIDGERCVIEKKIIYDKDGKCIFFYRGGSEGLIQYSRNYIKGYLPFGEEQLNYKIKIDKKNNWILDNNDTIRTFKVLKDEIITNVDSNGRFRVYKYK